MGAPEFEFPEPLVDPVDIKAFPPSVLTKAAEFYGEGHVGDLMDGNTVVGEYAALGGGDEQQFFAYRKKGEPWVVCVHDREGNDQDIAPIPNSFGIKEALAVLAISRALNDETLETIEQHCGVQGDVREQIQIYLNWQKIISTHCPDFVKKELGAQQIQQLAA